ncbi:hypothetical protein AVEN_175027-1, partial [Araneus ventricosus]
HRQGRCVRLCPAEGAGHPRLPQPGQGREGGPGDPLGHRQRQRAGQAAGPLLLRVGEGVRAKCPGDGGESAHPRQQCGDLRYSEEVGFS